MVGTNYQTYSNTEVISKVITNMVEKKWQQARYGRSSTSHRPSPIEKEALAEPNLVNLLDLII